MWRIGSDTSIFVALTVTFLLKLLALFNWVSWRPTIFLKGFVDDAVLRWLLLGVLLYVTAFVLYLLLQFFYKGPHYIVGLVLGVIIGMGIEWAILDLPAERAAFKQLSIPFLVIVTTSFVFIIETAAFHRERFVSRNDLPYKKSVLK